MECKVVNDLVRTISFGAILIDSWDSIVSNFFFFSKNLVILTKLLKTLEGLLWVIVLSTASRLAGGPHFTSGLGEDLS